MGVYQDIVRKHFESNLSLACMRETQTYITQIFVEINPNNDLSDQILTLVYNEAVQNYCFETFKELGDWLFFTKTLFPKNLRHASPQYYSSLASACYDKCYRILRKEWKLYEELADQFDILTRACGTALSSNDELFLFS